MSYTNALVSITIFLIVHLVAAVWWASHVNTVLTLLRESIENLNKTLAKHDEKLYSKVDASKDLAIRDRQIDAAFKKIDKIVDDCRQQHQNGNGGQA